jgi:hypothetical protein
VYDLVAEAGSTKTNGVRARHDEGTGVLPGLPAVVGKPVQIGFGGVRLTSDPVFVLLAAIEQRLGIADRLAACIEDRRDPAEFCTSLPR